MNPQLEALIMLQDLDLMIKEMSDQKTASQMTRIGFDVEAVENLTDARTEMAGKIMPEYLAIYERLMQRYQRAIVPIRNGICFACFLKQPTKYSISDQKVLKCYHCNRFLYFI